MFQLLDKNSGYLFSSRELRDLMEANRATMLQEVERIEGNRILNTAPADLARYLVEKYSFNPPSLERESWNVSETEAQIDVRYDQHRWIMDRSRPFLIPGQKIEIEVPIQGDPDLLYAQASTFSSSPPRAEIRGQSLFLTYQIAHDSPQRDIRKEAERVLDEIERCIGWLRSDLLGFNLVLPAQAAQAILARRTRILANQGRVAALGIPLKSRPDAPKTYTVPNVRRKIVPTLPIATTAAYEPEPALDMGNYEHILSVIQNMTHVMERSPSAFKSMGEEDLRQHFLVQLNGQFEGMATGETFNVIGKTDILLRANGKNVFIAECKFWRGSKHYRETIDQLLGYTAWRDTKTAILVFNRGTSMSTVIDAIKTETPSHDNFKGAVKWSHESGFRFMFRHNDDPNRELMLTVLVFDVPSAK